ncbi:hypothetical protein DFAR_2140005 [Desulfarculales bacterium]
MTYAKNGIYQSTPSLRRGAPEAAPYVLEQGMAAKSMLSLNSKVVEFEAGQTILEVARTKSVEIPTLWYLKDATPTGACRICLVQVKSARTLVAPCALPVSPGMEVTTDSPCCFSD